MEQRRLRDLKSDNRRGLKPRQSAGRFQTRSSPPRPSPESPAPQAARVCGPDPDHRMPAQQILHRHIPKLARQAIVFDNLGQPRNRLVLDSRLRAAFQNAGQSASRKRKASQSAPSRRRTFSRSRVSSAPLPSTFTPCRTSPRFLTAVVHQSADIVIRNVVLAQVPYQCRARAARAVDEGALAVSRCPCPKVLVRQPYADPRSRGQKQAQQQIEYINGSRELLVAAAEAE